MNDLIRHCGSRRMILVATSLLVSVTLNAKSAEAQRGSDEGKPKVQQQTKVYNIADLLDAPMMLSTGSREASSQTNAFDGGAGFGGGGSGSGGGGMFRVPDNILPQFGGGGMGGGGGGFGGGGGLGGGPAQSLSNGMTREALEQLVYDHVADNETPWTSIDGEGGALSIVASMMIVTHTPEVHAKIVQLLDALRIGNKTSPTVQVDLRIVEVAADQSVTLLAADAKSVEQLAADKSAARLSLRCDNHRVANVSSGLRRSYVVSLTPVVGSNAGIDAGGHRDNSIGYRPVTYSALLGLFGQIKPEIADDQQSGRIHLGIELTSGPEEVATTTFGTGQSVDRLEIESARLETSIATIADTWTLAGSVAVCDPTSTITSGEALPHLAVLVRWKPVQ